MGIQDWSDNIILVNLAQEPDMSEELRTVAEIVQDRGDCDVVVDFSAVDIIISSNIAKLLRVRKAVIARDRRVFLTGISTQVWGILLVTGLDKVFDVADDTASALTSLQMNRK